MNEISGYGIRGIPNKATICKTLAIIINYVCFLNLSAIFPKTTRVIEVKGANAHILPATSGVLCQY